MACTLQVVWDEQLAAYNFGALHPMTPVSRRCAVSLSRCLVVSCTAESGRAESSGGLPR